MAAVLVTGSVASAQRGRAAANQPANQPAKAAVSAARAKASAPRAKTPVKTVVKAMNADADAELDSPPAKPLPIAASALLVQYQRVGRDLLLLANERRAQIGIETADAKLACAELQAQFRAIKIDEATKTPESRVAAAAILSELHAKIERLRGVALTQDCLNNPLAKDCT